MGEGVSEKQKGRKKRAYLVHPRPSPSLPSLCRRRVCRVLSRRILCVGGRGGGAGREGDIGGDG